MKGAYTFLAFLALFAISYSVDALELDIGVGLDVSDCTVSSDCSNWQTCANQQCVDPCEGLCAANANCAVINHIPKCSCPAGYTGDPFSSCTRSR